MPDHRPTDALSPSREPDTTSPFADVRRRFLGKFRGTVANNVDPLQQGRIQVQVPDVYGASVSTWAMPCLPLAYVSTGVYVRPVVGSAVWIEFEQGDPNHPIWVGGFWPTGSSLPTAATSSVSTPPATPVITIESATGGLSISDQPIGAMGNVCLRSGGATITLSPSGIEIDAPQVTIKTPRFAVNDTALTVAGG